MQHIKRYFVLALVLLSGHIAAAQQKIRLNDNWEFVKQDLGSIWETVRPLTKDGPETYPIWQKVTLPHCFNARDAVDPDVNYYQGPGWYRTQLNISNPYLNGHTILHFEGAGQKTEVYIYTTKVGAHIGGYDEWWIDITQAVADFKKTEAFTKRFKGKVPVEIRCDNTRDAESIPSQMSDFNVYGGIYRYLNLVYQPAVAIGNVFASAVLDKGYKTGSIDIKSSFYDPDKVKTLNGKVTVTDASGKIVESAVYTLASIADGKNDICKFNINKPHLWTPSDPYLYTVEITAEANGNIHSRKEKIGFRDFLFSAQGPFYLNGKHLLLRGTHRHEDAAGVAAAMTEDMTIREMQMIKDMGANFIRLGHYQQSRQVLNLCDSLGLLVWEEEPWCRGGLGGNIYKEQARRMMTNMIEQHYNHPSIILWGLGNENDWDGDFPEFDKAKIRAFMTEQNNLSHQLDPSRKTVIRRCDFASDIPDVYSPTIWAGWYKGKYTQYKQLTQDEFKKVKYAFHAEWGGDSYSGRNSEKADKALENIRTNGVIDTALFSKSAKLLKDGDWSENATCNLFDWTLKEQDTMPWLSGTAFWTFKDFSTPIRFDNPLPYMNQKGVVERDLTKKELFYLVQSYWSDKPMAHIYGHNWSVRWGDTGELKMVKAYSNCDEAELFVNGKSYGVKKRNSQDFPAAGLRWMVPYNTGKNELLLKARTGKVIVMDTISQTYQTEKWGKPAKLNLEKIADKDGTTTIQATLTDSKGVMCLDAVNWVNFSLTGDGTLLDDMGTSKGSRKLQLINGRAVISIKTNGGKSVAGVQSAGIQTVFFNLN
ncbi:glycoside hydrolase family 2 protein [Mucilaginibacter sp. HMF5004]|uniref:glycoside hydrolase family 2 TIM barrel-domain containing protein n=1 Tax=Mucilaginibacter rivuli TaxID=2857527 RepID=UPI001C5D122D|nr:glycoside hydrolase family 2 TIM barrel-domain containing protein [Mucilaginibacter rivuli]MBW4888573.1 glycoside hydrolase family 2 protein [Mucilaginibacter rivuli]